MTIQPRDYTVHSVHIQFSPPPPSTPNILKTRGLSELSALENLEAASLRYCRGLGAEATLCLSNSPGLEMLNLAHCPLLDDAAIGNLTGLSKLRFLELEGCEVRAACLLLLCSDFLLLYTCHLCTSDRGSVISGGGFLLYTHWNSLAIPADYFVEQTVFSLSCVGSAAPPRFQ